jgi:hypothetical protein
MKFQEDAMKTTKSISIDATAFKIDHTDTGHIRLGEKGTFQPKEMEILDYRIEKNNSE